jgi:hypothetical protein
MMFGCRERNLKRSARESVPEEMLSVERDERWINGRKIVHDCGDNIILRRTSVLTE